MSGLATATPSSSTSGVERDAEIKRQIKIVESAKSPLDARALALCRIVDLRRDELLAGVDPRVDRVKLLETTKMLIREKAETVVGCTLSSVMRAVKVALLSGLAIDRFKGEVDFIPRARWVKVEGQEDKKIKELWADPNYRGMIHYVGNTGQMIKPPFVEAIFEGEQFEFIGDSDELRVKHVKNPLNQHRAKSDTGKVLAVYSRWYLKSGTVDHVMTWDQVIEHRDKYSKSYQDAEKAWGKKPARKDSFWHKEPLKAAFKTLIRDAVNRDKVPISRVDRGYVLDAARAEREEWTSTDVIDAEFAAVMPVDVDDEQPTDERAMIETPAPQQQQAAAEMHDETPQQAWARFEDRLAECQTTAECNRLYEAFFGQGAKHPWGDEERGIANETRAKRVDQIRKVTA